MLGSMLPSRRRALRLKFPHAAMALYCWFAPTAMLLGNICFLLDVPLQNGGFQPTHYIGQPRLTCSSGFSPGSRKWGLWASSAANRGLPTDQITRPTTLPGRRNSCSHLVRLKLSWETSHWPLADGGGIRRLSSLFILKELMVQIQMIELEDDVNPATHSFCPLEYRPPRVNAEPIANGNGRRSLSLPLMPRISPSDEPQTGVDRNTHICHATTSTSLPAHRLEGELLYLCCGTN